MSSSEAQVTFSPRHHEVVRLLIENGASLDGACAAYPLPAVPFVAGGASAVEPTASVQGVGVSYTLLESCMHAGASSAVAAIKAALNERAEASMKALILEEEIKTPTINRKDLTSSSRRQRTKAKATQPSAGGNDASLVTADTPQADLSGLASRGPSKGADAKDGTTDLHAAGGPTCAACNTLHATVLGRAAASEAVDTREALAERARRRASVKPIAI